MRLTLTTLSLLCVLCVGCGNDDMHVNEFIRENGTPCVVYKVKSNECKECGINYTIVAPNGKIILVKNSQLMLPDTLK